MTYEICISFLTKIHNFMANKKAKHYLQMMLLNLLKTNFIFQVEMLLHSFDSKFIVGDQLRKQRNEHSCVF